nr:CTP synthase [Clostridiales bacterium]
MNGLAGIVCKKLSLPCGEPDLSDWRKMVNTIHTSTRTVKIGLVGKYVKLHDAYLSVAEALFHGGIANGLRVQIDWVGSETITDETAAGILGGYDGIIVPGGFGDRGIEGIICAIRYARESRKPFFGICLGMQLAVVEFARNVLGLADANSGEFSDTTKNAVIDILEEQKNISDKGGTMRLGLYPCVIADATTLSTVYGERTIHERHRHRYEFNNAYLQAFIDNGMTLCGVSPDGMLVEAIELDGHPWYVAVQYHPEFKSRPNRAHPLFRAFIAAAGKTSS